MDIKNEKLIYQSEKISVVELSTPRGTRILLDLGVDAVLVVPITSNGDYILTVQNRAGKDEPVYEFPSGGIREGESPQEAAKRELKEEVGAKASLSFIAKVEPLSGLVKFNIYIFSAIIDEISEEDKFLDEHELVSTVQLSEIELLNKIKSMEIVDGYIILGLGALNLKKN